MAEVLGSNRFPAAVQLAARWTVIPEHLFLDAAWGRQGGEMKPTWRTLGLKLGF